MIAIAGKKINKSLFIKRYYPYLKEWCQQLEHENSTIFAISRKGPRLIELLVREGLLSKIVLDRLITEHAIPFYDFSPNEKIVLIDDSVQHGSTFKRITGLLHKEAELQNCQIKIIGLPFASAKNVPETNLDAIQKAFYPLASDEINAFINCQISSFRLLGKPYDIEHPIFHIMGNFQDDFILEAALTDFVNNIKIKTGQDDLQVCIQEEPITLADNRSVYHKNYTILFDDGSVPDEQGASFSKIRIFVNTEKSVISIVPIRPIALSNQTLAEFKNSLPNDLEQVWKIITSNIKATEENNSNDLYYETQRSKAVVANYLCSYLLLRKFHSELVRVFKGYYSDIFFEGFRKDDLQYILGTMLGREIVGKLNSFIGNYNNLDLDTDFVKQCLPDCVLDENYPSEYSQEYNNFLQKVLPLCETPYEILSYLFYAQHRKIEVPSRLNSNDNNDRLRFGITLKRIIEIVRQYIKNANSASIHEALDKLIDSGTIVPKYMNLSKAGDKNIWLRVFRVGEGSTLKRIQVLIFIAEQLTKKLNSESIPALLLEKLSVLIVTDDFPIPELRALEDDLKIKRGFGLYGARAQVKTLNNIQHYLDFGEKHQIFSRDGDKYIFNKEIRETFPIDDLHLTRPEKRKIIDIIAFGAYLQNTKNLQSKALVTVTTLGSEDDYFLALNAELDLWLNHPSYNIFECLTELMNICSLDAQIQQCILNNTNNDALLKQKTELLEKANNLLARNALITAQVRDKSSMYADRIKTFDAITSSLPDSETIERVWEDIFDILKKKRDSRQHSSGLNEILSALRLAHRITTITRNLLSIAGYVHSKHTYKPGDLKLSVIKLKETLSSAITSDSLSATTLQLFARNGSNPSISEKLDTVIDNIADETEYSVCVNLLRPILHVIAEKCELLLNKFGSRKSLPIEILSPPQYVLMWDVRRSTDADNRIKDIEDGFVQKVNERIEAVLDGKIRNFKVDMNDGNAFITDNFEVVLAAFELMYQVAVRQNLTFRAGCDVNYQGELHFYPTLNVIAGRGYEFAARVMAFFKEKDGRWNGENIDEPHSSYLIVSELAQRIADANSQWLGSNAYSVFKPEGKYAPRLKTGTSFPFSLFIIKEKD